MKLRMGLKYLLIVVTVLAILAIAPAFRQTGRFIMVNFDWSETRGFAKAEIYRPKEVASPNAWSKRIDALLAAQAKPKIAREFKGAGWHRAQGEVAIYTLGYMPLVLGLDRTIHWKIIDPDKSPLMLAAEKCDLSSAKQLLLDGADPNARDQQGYTPLMYAARNPKDCTEIADLLLAQKVEVGATDRFGNTALCWAVLDGVRPNTVRLLVASGADVNVKSGYQNPVLLEAVASGGDESKALSAVRILVGAGADIKATNPQGLSALSLAEKIKRQSIVQFLQQLTAKK